MTENAEARMGLEDLAESLNGWEEIAVQKMFGFSIDSFEDQGTLGIRALVFVEFKREGMKDPQAHKAALDLTMRELIDRYPEMAEDNDEVPNPMASIDGAESGKE